MRTFKKIAFVMVAAWVAASATAKTSVGDRSLTEAGFQKAAAAPDRGAAGQAASYTAAKKEKVQAAQAVKNTKTCTSATKKKAAAKKEVAAKKASVKKAVANAPVK